MASPEEPDARRRIHLPLISNTAPPAKPPSELEQALARVAPHSQQHQQLLECGLGLVEETVKSCIAPSFRATADAALVGLRKLAKLHNAGIAIARQRSALIAAAPEIRAQTVDVMRAALAAQARQENTLLDPHADATVLRYVGLAASHTVSATLLLTDALTQPRALAVVPLQCAGALAYRNTGLGAARSSELRQRACVQAEQELKDSGSASDSAGAIAIQLFHEFLGATWRDHSDAHRLSNEAALRRAWPSA